MIEALPANFNVLVKAMKVTGTLSLLNEVIVYHYEKELKGSIIPEVREMMSADDSVTVMVEIIEKLHEFHSRYLVYISNWRDMEKLKKKLQTTVVAHLQWDLLGDIKSSMKRLLTFILKFFMHYFNEDEKKDDSEVYQTKDKLFKRDSATYEEVKEFLEGRCQNMFCTFIKKLHLGEMINTDLIVEVLFEPITTEIRQSCTNFEYSYASSNSNCYLMKLRDERIVPFFKLIYDNDWDKRNWLKRIDFILYNVFTKKRIADFRSIIWAYPDSEPAVDDLKFCLDYTGLRPALIKSLKRDIQKKVLHPGSKTKIIIQAYVSVVKVLRYLDPTGVVMEMVLTPCTQYLRQREDAVRQIIDLLTSPDGGGGELSMELNEAGASTPSAASYCCWEDRVTESPEDWMPDSRESDPVKTSNFHRNSDVVSHLIGMYGSKEKFIKEYQKLLSKRLQQNWFKGINELKEVRNLEFFKIKFGEDEVSKCTVMFKDLTDSRRINENFVETLQRLKRENSQQEEKEEENEMEFRTFVISHHFWPEMSDIDIKLPEQVQRSFDRFKQDYERQKASRSLRMVKGVGSVELELEFEDEKRSYKVTPVQATIIHKFGEKDQWSLEELSASLEIPQTILLKRMQYWIQVGVIRQTASGGDEVGATYTAVDRISQHQQQQQHYEQQLASGDNQLVDDNEDDDDDDDAAQEKQQQELDIIWSYVRGMLCNCGSLPVERIVSMLNMFDTNESLIDVRLLRDFLNRKVQAGQLACEAGKYKLVE